MGGGITWRSVQCLYGVCKRDGNSKLASDMYGAHVIFVHDNVMERCGEKYANWRCRRQVRKQRGRREVSGDSRMYGGKPR